jgi:hypothetical protein
VASVIPLLFIAAAFEGQLFTEKAVTGLLYDPIGDAIVRLLLIGMMVWGEVAALSVLGAEHESADSAVITVGGLIAAGVLVVAPMVRAQLDAIKEQSEKAALIVSGAIGLLIVGLCIYGLAS